MQKPKQPPPGMARTTVNMRPELLRRLKHLAVDRNASLGELLSQAVEHFLAREEGRKRS